MGQRHILNTIMLFKHFDAIHFSPIEVILCSWILIQDPTGAVHVTVCHNRSAGGHFCLFTQPNATVSKQLLLINATGSSPHNSMQQFNTTHATCLSAGTQVPRSVCCESDSKSCSVRFPPQNFESWKCCEATRQNECENMAPSRPSLARGWVEGDHKIVKRAWVSLLPSFPRLSGEVCLWWINLFHPQT